MKPIKTRRGFVFCHTPRSYEMNKDVAMNRLIRLFVQFTYVVITVSGPLMGASSSCDGSSTHIRLSPLEPRHLTRDGGRWEFTRIGPGGALGSASTPLRSLDDTESRHVVTPNTDLRTENDANVRQYQLILSPGVPIRILILTVIIAAFRVVLGRSGIRARLLTGIESTSSSCHGTIPFVDNVSLPLWIMSSGAMHNARHITVPLLASACCAFQLLINAVLSGMGCVGFNTYLGPLRPLFLASLINSTISSYTLAMSSSSSSSSSMWKASGIACVSWIVALMPEMVHWNNRRKYEKYGQRGPAAGTPWIALANNSNALVVYLSIPSMGCVSCIQKVSSSLRKALPSVVSAQSWLVDPKGGFARVVFDPTSVTPQSSAEKCDAMQDIYGLTQRLVGAVKEAGFQDCELSSMEEIQTQIHKEVGK